MIKIIKEPKCFPDTVYFTCGLCGCEYLAQTGKKLNTSFYLKSDPISIKKTSNEELIASCKCPVCNNDNQTVLML